MFDRSPSRPSSLRVLIGFAIVAATLLSVTAAAQSAFYKPTWTVATNPTPENPSLPYTFPYPSVGAPFHMSMAYDEAIGKIVMLILDGSATVGQTWLWDGTTWTQFTPTNGSTPTRFDGGLAYDRAIGKLVLYGGDGANDTWTFDGSSWTKQSPATSPPAENIGTAPLVYDDALQKVVYYDAATFYTWLYDGTTWTQLATTNSPPAREYTMMAYDQATAKIVLFGGDNPHGQYINQNYQLADTWTFDGTNWTQQSPATNPPARSSAYIAYDSRSGKVFLFGGEYFFETGNSSNPTGMTLYRDDFWEWDGTNWSLVPTEAVAPYLGPQGMSSGQMASFLPTGQLFMYGGYSGEPSYDTYTQDIVWLTQPGNDYDFGTANVCSDSSCNITQTLYFEFSIGGAMQAPAVTTQGVAGLDFKDAGTGSCTTAGNHTYNAGDICTVDVVFAPTAPGRRTGAVTLLNSSGAVVGTELLSGTGKSPLGLYTTPTATTIASSLNDPRGLTVDAAGNVYVSEWGALKLDKISSAGVKTQYNVSLHATGIAVDGASNIFFAATNKIYEIPVGSTTATPYASGSNTYDNNLQVDSSGNLFVTTSSGHALYEIPASTKTPVLVFPGATAFIGSTSGATTDRLPSSAIDANDNLYFTDINNRVYEVLAGSTYPILVIDKDGTSSAPEGIAIDPAGDLYVTPSSGSANLIRYTPPFSAGAAAIKQQFSTINGTIGAAVGSDGTLYTLNGTSILKYARSSGPAIEPNGAAALNVNQVSPTTLEQFENDGNAALSISSLAASNTNFTAFAATDGSYLGCGSTLAIAATCGLGFQFTPQTVGALTGNGVVTDNSYNNSASTQTIALSGTGVQAPQTIAFSPTTTGYIGTQILLAATSTSGLPVTISIVGGTGSATLSGTNNSIINYTGTGTVQIQASQAGNVNYSAATPVTVTVTVYAATSYTAPTTAVGATSSTQTANVMITTAGTPTAISVLTQGVSGLDYVFVSGGTCSTSVAYTIGQNCTVEYTFSPLTPGARFGAVQLVAGSSILGTSLVSGTGTGPAVVFPTNNAHGPIGPSTFGRITGVAVDAAGDVYLADGVSSTVSEVVATGGAVSSTSVVKPLGSGFSTSFGVAIDGAGNVYVADAGNNAVKEIVAVNGVTSSSSSVVTIGSGFSSPRGVAVDAFGDVFVADSGNNAVKEIIALGGSVSDSSTINTIGSTFSNPYGVAVDNTGNVYVADYGNNAVKEIVASGGITTSSSTVNILGSGFNQPTSVAVDTAGNVYVTDSNALKEIIAVSGATSSTSTVVSRTGGNYLSGGVAVDGDGNMYVGDYYGAWKILVTNPPNIVFANTTKGSTSSDSPNNVQVQNVGNTVLNITSVAGSTDFPFSTAAAAPCGTTLTPDSICDVAVSFTPTTTIGGLAGTLTFTDDNLNVSNATQTGQLSGTSVGISQTINFTQPTSPATNQTATLTATGGASGNPVTFAITFGIGYATLSGTNNSTITYVGYGTIHITASQAGNSSYAAAADVTRAVVVNSSFGSLQFSTPYPTPSATGIAQSITITALDAIGNTYTNFTGQVALSTSDTAAIMPTPYNFAYADHGSHTFTGVKLVTAGTQSITATTGTSSVTQSGIFTGGLVTTLGGGMVTKFYTTGTQWWTSNAGASPTAGLASDNLGRSFSVDPSTNVLTRLGRAGLTQSATGFTGGGLNSSNQLAVDGNDNVWITNNNNSLSEFTNNGIISSTPATPLTPSTGYTGPYSTPTGIAIDLSGNVWVANSGNNTITEVLGAAGPAPPLSTGITNYTIGTRP